jgi:hypothetical protein
MMRSRKNDDPLAKNKTPGAFSRTGRFGKIE